MYFFKSTGWFFLDSYFLIFQSVSFMPLLTLYLFHSLYLTVPLGNQILLIASADAQTCSTVSLYVLYSGMCVHLQQGNPSQPELTSCPFTTILMFASCRSLRVITRQEQFLYPFFDLQVIGLGRQCVSAFSQPPSSFVNKVFKNFVITFFG